MDPATEVPWIAAALMTALVAGSDVLLMALAVPLIRRRVPPNAWYGVRVAATFADREVWYETNARAGRDLFVAGALHLALLLVLMLAPGVPFEGRMAIAIGTITAAVLVVAVRAWRHANRLLAERQRRA